MTKFFRVLAAAAILWAGLTGLAQAERKLAATHFGALTYGIPLAIATSEGYFEEAGVQLDGILTSKGGATAIRNGLASDFKYGEVGIPALMAARESGLDLVVVNVAVASHGDVTWVAKKGSPYTKLEDLRGKTVTYTNPKSGSETNIREIMRLTGVEMNLVAAGGLREALSMVATDAAAAAPMVEPIATLQADKFQTVIRVTDHLPRMVTIVGFAPRDWAEENAEDVRNTIAARRKAVQLIYEDPARAAQAAVAGGYRYPVEVMEKVIRDLAEEKFWSEGEIVLDRITPNISQMLTVGAIKDENVDWSKVIVRDYLPEDLRSKK